MKKSPEELDSAVRAAFAEEARELLRQVELALHGMAGGEAAERGARCLEMLRGLHTLKGAAASVGEEQVKLAAHAMEALVHGVQEGTLPLTGEGLEAVFTGLERLYLAVDAKPWGVGAPAFVPEAAAPPAVEGSRGEEPLRVSLARVEALHAQMGELVLCQLRQETLTRRLAEVRDSLGEAMELWRELEVELQPLRRALPPEQWAALKSSRNAYGPALSGALQALSGVTREASLLLSQSVSVGTGLEEGLRELRLMPLQPFLEEYARVVRETARACGKEALLEVRASGAEVDRAVLTRLREALLHLVRNAVVHGLETPERRRAVGKPAVGGVTLEARCEGARAFLRVADDGAGIDVERVRQRGRELGMAVEESALDAEGLMALLSHPGFSTRGEADELAGRGIGLDVVASTLRELDGQLQLEHIPGKGTAFILDVPISASTLRGLMVQVEEDCFGLLLPQVDQVFRLRARDVSLLEGRSVVRVGGELVAVTTLARLLGMEARGSETHERPAVLLRQGRQKLAVLVDDVLSELRLIIKPLGEAFTGSPLVLGGAVLPDGSVLPVLEVSALFARAAGGSLEEGAPKLTPLASPAPRHSVLVVDDSPSMRTLLCNILRAAGYDARGVSDGQAALEAWRQHPPGLVITDLQMPRMDGIDVCRSIRQSPGPRTPVILITSRDTPEQRLRALEAGVDAFISKGEFEQLEFLEWVKTLTDRARASDTASSASGASAPSNVHSWTVRTFPDTP